MTHDMKRYFYTSFNSS